MGPEGGRLQNKNKRLEALSDISRALEIPKEEVERKLKNLIGQFSRECKKMRRKECGQRCKWCVESRWFAFKHLLFLKNRSKQRSTLGAEKALTAGNECDTYQKNAFTQSQEDKSYILPTLEHSGSVRPNEEREGSTEFPASSRLSAFFLKKRSFPKTNIRENTSKHARLEDSLVSEVEAFKQTCPQQSAVNEFGVFGQHVACQLQQLPLEEALKLQEKIQSLLTRARLHSIRFASPTFVPSENETLQDEKEPNIISEHEM